MKKIWQQWNAALNQVTAPIARRYSTVKQNVIDATDGSVRSTNRRLYEAGAWGAGCIATSYMELQHSAGLMLLMSALHFSICIYNLMERGHKKLENKFGHAIFRNYMSVYIKGSLSSKLGLVGVLIAYTAVYAPPNADFNSSEQPKRAITYQQKQV